MASLDSSDESLTGSSRRRLSVSRTTKRRRLVKLDEAGDDSDDSASDDALWPSRASTTARRITTSAGGTTVRPADSDDSVSTAELARRIRGTATPLSAATRTRPPGTAPSPSVPLEVLGTQQYSSTLSPTGTNPRSLLSGVVVGKEEAVFSLPRLGGDNTLPSPWRPRQRPTWKDADDDEGDDSSAVDSDDDPALSKYEDQAADDDDDSVSTAELARRIRGPPAKAQPQQPAPLAASRSTSLRKENVRHPETMEDDFFLPSPLPSEEDDESSLSGDDARDLPCVPPPPPPPQQAHPQPSSVAPPEPQWWEDEQEEPHDENPYDDQEEPPPQKLTRASPPRQGEHRRWEGSSVTSGQAIVREGLRSPLGPWARQRQLNATGTIFAHHPTLAARRRSQEPPHHDDVTVVDDIGTFSDAEEGPAAAQSPSPVVGDHVQTHTRRRLPPVRSIRHTTDPSMAANVVPRGRSSASSSTTTALGRSLAWPTRSAEFASSRNDLRGGSGVGAGQYEIIAPPPPQPAPRARGGGGAGRGRGRGKKRGGRGRGRGRGRDRSRGASRGRGRGGGRGSSSSQGNAWSDYSTQTASWPSSQQGSNLGHVGGAEISF